MAHVGLLTWANDIKFSLANDPGRAIFEDQVNKQCSYLTSYLDEILAGGRSETLIDLVKTPGRKKAQARFDDRGFRPTGDLFKKGGFDVSDNNAEIAVSVFQDASPSPTDLRMKKAEAARPTPAASNVFEDTLDNLLLPPSTDNQLSVIAEENEESLPRASAPTSQKFPSTHSPRTIRPIFSAENRSTRELSVSHATVDVRSSAGQSTSVSEPLIQHDTNTGKPLIVPEPAEALGNSLSTADVMIEDVDIPLRRSPSPTSQNKPEYAALPAPLPFRKSVRAMNDLPVPSAVLAGSTTELPKRTSWLKKAREVKALDIQGSKDTGVTRPTEAVRTSQKRKSADMLMASGVGEEASGPLPKTAKSEGQDSVSPQVHIKVAEPAVGSASAFQGVEHEANILEILREKVDGLGHSNERAASRTPDNGTAMALAEARAAAEAKIAGRIDTGIFNNSIPSIRNEDTKNDIPSITKEASPPTFTQDPGNSQPGLKEKPPIVTRSSFDFDRPVFRKPSPAPAPQSQPPNSTSQSTWSPPAFVKAVPTMLGLSPHFAADKPGQSSSYGNLPQSVPAWQMHTDDSIKLGQDDDDDDDDEHDLDNSWMEGDSTDVLPAVLALGGEDTGTWSSSHPTESLRLPSEPTTDQRLGDFTSSGFENRPQDTMASIPELEPVLDAPDMEPEKPLPEAPAEPPQSQGIFSQATRLVTSVLGGGKKPKPEVKSLQLAAAAAKKQQEEREKKAQVLKNMEIRRQQALQRKLEEERAAALEAEKRAKEEIERRKRERDEAAEKKVSKILAKKEDESNKKRKLEEESERKTESKKPIFVKPAVPGHATTAQASKGQFKPKSKQLPSANEAHLDDISQPAQLLQSQMAARAQAQMRAAQPQSLPKVRSEDIELPDFSSEYSNSDDEGRHKDFPDWVQSPNLRQALEEQSHRNPDAIFGPIRPIRMDEIFRNRAAKLRPRSSSANWSGADRLTTEEEVEYARRMGYQ